MMRWFFGLLVGLVIAVIVVDRYEPGTIDQLFNAGRALIDRDGPGTTDRLISNGRNIIDSINPGLSDRMASDTISLIRGFQGLLPAASTTDAKNADALDIFEGQILPIVRNTQNISFTYDSAERLGRTGFILKQVVLRKGEVGKIDSLEIRDIDVDNFKPGGRPNRMSLHMEGYSPDPTIQTAIGAYLGGAQIKANFTASFELSDDGTLNLREASLDLPGLARLAVQATITGLPPLGKTFEDTDPSKYYVRQADITYDDASLLSRVANAVKKENDKDPDAEVAEFIKTLKDTPPDGARDEGAADLVAFLADYKTPKGSLKVIFNPPRQIGVTSLEPDKIILSFFEGTAAKDFGAKIAYERPQTPSETPQYKSADKKTITKLVETGAKPPPVAVPALGLMVSDIDAELKQQYSLNEDTKGIVVIDVAKDSEAWAKGMTAGDVIAEVAQDTISAKEMPTKIDAALRDGRKSVLLLIISHGGNLRFVALQLGPPQPLPPTPSITKTSPSEPDISAARRDGHADRQAWEQWFASLSSEVRAGADFWAGIRTAFWIEHRTNRLSPPPCPAAGHSPAFVSGCTQAKARLDPTDARRRADPEYAAGWNSPLQAATDTTSQGSAEPSPTTRVIDPLSRSPEFATGFSGGRAVRGWLHSLSGDALAGAEYWIAHRNCTTTDNANAAFRATCARAEEQYRTTYAAIDRDPEFRAGFSYGFESYAASPAGAIPPMAPSSPAAEPDRPSPPKAPSSDDVIIVSRWESYTDVFAENPTGPAPIRGSVEIDRQFGSQVNMGLSCGNEGDVRIMIGISNANFDIGRGDLIIVQVKIDDRPRDDKNIELQNNGRFEFSPYSAQLLATGSRLLIRLPINGTDRDLGIPLKLPTVANLMSQCAVIEKRVADQKAAEKARKAAQCAPYLRETSRISAEETACENACGDWRNGGVVRAGECHERCRGVAATANRAADNLYHDGCYASE